MHISAEKTDGPMLKILFVASEAHPLVKTGGLGDIAGSLPAALQSLHADVRLLLPAYRDAMAVAGKLKTVARIFLPNLAQGVRLLEGKLPGTRVKTWLVDFPPAFDRPGNPYLNAHGQPWHDNASRYTLFARVATQIALSQTGLKWQPDVVHCHDWQTGLVPALLAQEEKRPATIFTIHNLAYQGLFPHETFTALGLPSSLWSHDALEFHDSLSFIKGGLVFADRLTTVSPTYAREIQTPEFGCGLDGLLRFRAAQGSASVAGGRMPGATAESLTGILNGIDDKIWNPAGDTHIVKRYSAHRLSGKQANKPELQKAFGLPHDPRVPLIGIVGRMVQQKGIDLVLKTIPELMKRSVQMVMLGTGDADYENQLRAQAARFPAQLSVRIGYDEDLAHLVEAGADMFLMPSRFEPCGLNQLYSLRYGTLPIVRRIGGLADTVVDATPENLSAGTATGIVFEQANADELIHAVERALTLYQDKPLWRKTILTGMRQDFGWHHSATEYLHMYEQTLLTRKP
jgi:starch synthase